MGFIILLVAAVALLFGWAICSAWYAGCRGHSEEKAHARACRRRLRSAPSRSSSRSPASIMILGQLDSRSECRVTYVSPRHVRVCGLRAYPHGAQVRVEHGADEFIGYVLQNQDSLSGSITEIAVSSTTFAARGLIARFARSFQS